MLLIIYIRASSVDVTLNIQHSLLTNKAFMPFQINEKRRLRNNSEKSSSSFVVKINYLHFDAWINWKSS